MMKGSMVLLAGWLAVLPVALPAAQDAPSPTHIERAFPSGGSVGLDLSAGGYVIRGTPDEVIRVRWRTRSASDARRVANEVAIEGNSASIRTRGPKDGFTVEIDLPQRTDINLSLSAGDLKVRGLEGNKAISMWAGDALIEVGNPDLYRQVDATVRMGDLTLQPFGLGSTGGLFRSRSWTGPGQYTIRANLTAGDLKLVR